MILATRINSAFETANRGLASSPVWLAAIAALATFQTFLIVTHEPWADELQALLIATEAPDISTMFAWLRYEGHPPSWYSLLRGLAQLVKPEAALWVAALLVAALVQSAILFAAPFGRAERLLLASSQYVLFEFLTISRGTSLGVGLLVLAMLLWRSRWLWLVMALLPTVDFLFGVISGVFLILKWRERDIWWPGVTLWLAGSAFAAWSIIPAPDMVSANEAMVMPSGLTSWLMKMGSMPLPFQGGISPRWNSPVVPIAGFGWIIMLVLCWVLTRGQTWHRLLIFGFFGFTLAFSLALYPIGLRHLMLGAFLLILLIWRQAADRSALEPRKLATFQVWLLVLAISGIASSTISAVKGFDSAPQVMAEIERRGLADKHWIMLPEWRSAAIAARSDIIFGRPSENCSFSFVRWDHEYNALASPEAFTAMLEAEIEIHGRTYLISDMTFNGFAPDLIAPLVTIPPGYSGVDYNLYVVGQNVPERSVTLPQCHSKGSLPAQMLP